MTFLSSGRSHALEGGVRWRLERVEERQLWYTGRVREHRFRQPIVAARGFTMFTFPASATLWAFVIIMTFIPLGTICEAPPEAIEAMLRNQEVSLGPWSPILEDLAIVRRDDKVMQAKPTAFVVNRPSMGSRPPPPTAADREVSETDLYLLGAIEKLVYRVDFMEKRLRRTEELLYFVMAGNNHDDDPCPNNFTRAGKNCYHFSSREYNWKSSASMCKSLGATLAELESVEENQDVVAFIQTNKGLKGKDYWTGGLNPGLLWIWSNSARPVSSNTTSTATNIRGSGRCLKLAYNPATNSYAYHGSDCTLRTNYICELEDNRASRALERLEETLREQRSLV